MYEYDFKGYRRDGSLMRASVRRRGEQDHEPVQVPVVDHRAVLDLANDRRHEEKLRRVDRMRLGLPEVKAPGEEVVSDCLWLTDNRKEGGGMNRLPLVNASRLRRATRYT